MDMRFIGRNEPSSRDKLIFIDTIETWSLKLSIRYGCKKINFAVPVKLEYINTWLN